MTGHLSLFRADVGGEDRDTLIVCSFNGGANAHGIHRTNHQCVYPLRDKVLYLRGLRVKVFLCGLDLQCYAAVRRRLFKPLLKLLIEHVPSQERNADIVVLFLRPGKDRGC